MFDSLSNVQTLLRFPFQVSLKNGKILKHPLYYGLSGSIDSCACNEKRIKSRVFYSSCQLCRCLRHSSLDFILWKHCCVVFYILRHQYRKDPIIETSAILFVIIFLSDQFNHVFSFKYLKGDCSKNLFSYLTSLFHRLSGCKYGKLLLKSNHCTTYFF